MANLLPMTLVFHIGAGLEFQKVPVNAPRKAAKDIPSPWTLATHLGPPDGVPGS